MSAVPAAPVETPAAPATPATPTERLREKLATMRGNRVNEAARAKAKGNKAKKAPTAVERLLTADERRKMKKKTRKAQKNNIERLLKQSGITDPATRNKVFAGIQNGTIGSEAELTRFLEQEKQAQAKKEIVVSVDPESTRIHTNFSLASLRGDSGYAPNSTS